MSAACLQHNVGVYCFCFIPTENAERTFISPDRSLFTVFHAWATANPGNTSFCRNLPGVRRRDRMGLRKSSSRYLPPYSS